MSKPITKNLICLALGVFLAGSGHALADGESCQVFNVAATKVWLEKPNHKDKDKDKKDKDDKDKKDKDSPDDKDKGKGNDDKDKKDKDRHGKGHGHGHDKLPKPQKPEEDVSCDKDERSKDVFYIDADLDFEKVGTFTVPDVIPVVEGKSRQGDHVLLEMGVHDCDGFSGVVTCVYQRMPPKTKPKPRDEWARYRFSSCSQPGITPGKKVTGNALSLHVAAGGKNCPDNRTTVAFSLNACGVGDLLPATP